VEDNALIANTLALILEGNGFLVTIANDGSSGFEAFRAGSPDIVLSDIVMPKLNGIELAKKIREAGNVPVLLVSGQTLSVELLENAAREGYRFDVLPKPVHPEALMNAIRVKLSETKQ
jgi:DNA-binding response OmpR family regulator